MPEDDQLADADDLALHLGHQDRAGGGVDVAQGGHVGPKVRGILVPSGAAGHRAEPEQLDGASEIVLGGAPDHQSLRSHGRPVFSHAAIVAPAEPLSDRPCAPAA